MGRAMTRVPLFEQLRTEQDQLREQAGFLKRAEAQRGLNLLRRPERPRRWTSWGLAAAFCVAASVVIWQQVPAQQPPFAFTVGDGQELRHAGAFVAAPSDRELPLRFADGTRFALAAGSSARVASLDVHGAHLVIEKGRAVAAVVHRPDSRWRVDVGPFQVAVVGTRFDISWDVATRVLELRLDEGAVRVSGGLLNQALEVRAGQRLRAFADDARVELSDAAGARAEVPAQADGSDAAARTEPMASVARALAVPAPALPSGPPRWRTLAAAGKFREALAAAEQAGFEAECARASGGDLLALADAARVSGSAARAEQAYTAAHSKLPGGGRASYGLGLVAFDQRGDFMRAVRYFEAYLREQPNGSLRAEATGRLMEAWQRAGHVSEARRIAEQYLARYPQGPQAVRAKQLLQ
jgi:ferric-dicitrate binding protein FerR (iron transport regulator)